MLRLATVTATVGVIAAVAGCGGAAPDPGVLRHSGAWYRTRPKASRTRVAEACRAQAAATAGNATARTQLRRIDANELRDALDEAETVIARGRRPLAEVCRDVVPFHTPGLRVRFGGGARGGGGTWSVEAISTRPYAMRGWIAPPRAGARVTARRTDGYTVRGSVRADGSFVLPVRFRHVADNTFTVTVTAPPAAEHKLLFSAICLDCLAGAPQNG